MPTAAKLVAAIVFALVGWLAADAVARGLSQGTYTGLLREITAVIGLGVGWVVMGPLTGRGYGPAVGTGLRCSATVVFWALLAFASYEMLLRSTRARYDGPMEAVLAVIDLVIDRGQMVLAVPPLAVLVIGGALGGVLAEAAARRWA
ncbi:MAG: TrgA family protein [Rhodobacterales bacterium]|nr:TrgA family protein [Rhodobacterales bacterium]